MKTKLALVGILFAALIPLISSAQTAPSASIVGLYPASEVPIGAKVSFSVQTVGFTNPTFWVTDSFGGGVTNINIDSNGDFSWTPNQDEVGTHDIAIAVSDSLGDTASVSQTIVVDGAPSVSINSVSSTSVEVGTPINFSVSSLGLFAPTYSVADSFSASSVQSYDLSGTTFNWTPVYQDVGSHTIVATAKDSYGNTAQGSVTITVTSPFPAASVATTTPAAQPATSTPVQTPAPTPAQTPAVTPPKTQQPTTQPSIQKSAQPTQATPTLPPVQVTQTPAESTDQPETSFASTALPDAPIVIPTQQSFGAFVVGEIGSFFASLFKIF